MRRGKSMAFVFLLAGMLFLNVFFVSAQEYTISPDDSIQEALEKAMPGDTIHLEDGEYHESFVTVRDGTSENPITIKGSLDAVIKGDGEGRMIQVFHDHIHFKGFTVNGLDGDPDEEDSYTDKLIYVLGQEEKDGVTGFKALDMALKNSGGEALRLRYYAEDAEIAHCTFENTGMHDFKFDAGGKNGEAIYIGTSSNQWDDGKNPESGPDKSTGNWVHDNYFNTQANECVDIKEGATGNIVEHNICTGQKDPESAGLDSRGNGNIFRYNEVYGCEGAGVRLGGHEVDGKQYGKNNYVYGNEIYDNEYGAVKTMVSPQENICNNELSGNGDGHGDYEVNPASDCNSIDAPDADVPDSDDDTTEDTEENTGEQEQDSSEEDNTGDNAEEDTKVNFDDSLEIEDVQATSDDGNIPANTLDGDLDTRWSAEGDGEYIQYDLGDLKDVEQVGIAFYKGDQRVQDFEVKTSEEGIEWTTTGELESSGETLKLQYFDVDEKAQFVRIVGFGNTENNWNSLTEVRVFGEEETEETKEDNSEETSSEENTGVSDSEDNENSEEIIVERSGALDVEDFHASSHDGNVPSNTLDGDLDTRWSAEGAGQFIQYDLGEVKEIKDTGIAFYKGDQRVQEFKIRTSIDKDEWETQVDGKSSGETLSEQLFEVNEEARYIRIVGLENTENEWNSLTEVNFYSFESDEEEREDSKDNEETKDTNEETIEIEDFHATSDDGNVPSNTMDEELDTRWSAEGDGEYIQYDLGETEKVKEVGIAFYKGDQRVQDFEIKTSEDKDTWETAFEGESSGETTKEQEFEVEEEAQFVRIVGFGNTENNWNSLTETNFYG